MVVRWSIPLLLLAAVACRGREEQKPLASDAPVAAAAAPLAERIGWWHGRCLAISNERLASGTPVALVVIGEPQVVRAGRIGERVNSAERCAPLMEGRAAINAKPGMSFYALEVDSIETTDMGFGIFSAPNMPTVVNGLAETNLTQDQHKHLFTSCAGSEGIRFAVWADTANAGEPLWSGYYYLGYDMVPTCP
jgi:hypothetical protein